MLLLPSSTLNFVGRLVNVGWHLYFVPYRWDGRVKRFLLQKSPLFTPFYMAQLGLCIMYQTFTMIRWLQTLHSSKTTLFWAVRLTCMTSIKISGNISHLVTFQNRGQIHVLLTNILETARIDSSAMEKRSKMNVLRPMLIVAAIWVVGGITDTLIPFKNPSSPTHLTSLARNPKALHFWVKFSFACLQLYLNFFHYYYIVLYFSTVFLYLGAVLQRMKLLIRCHTKHEKGKLADQNDGNGNAGSSELGQTEEVILEPSVGLETGEIDRKVRSGQGLKAPTTHHWDIREMKADDFRRECTRLSILQKHMNATFNWFILVMAVAVIECLILCCFEAIVFHTKRGFVLFTLQSIVLFVLVTLVAQVYEQSSIVMTSWKSKMSPDWFPKFWLSCPPIRVTLGSFMYADNGWILTVFDIVVNYSVTMLVTYRE